MQDQNQNRHRIEQCCQCVHCDWARSIPRSSTGTGKGHINCDNFSPNTARQAHLIGEVAVTAASGQVTQRRQNGYVLSVLRPCPETSTSGHRQRCQQKWGSAPHPSKPALRKVSAGIIILRFGPSATYPRKESKPQKCFSHRWCRYHHRHLRYAEPCSRRNIERNTTNSYILWTGATCAGGPRERWLPRLPQQARVRITISLQMPPGARLHTQTWKPEQRVTLAALLGGNMNVKHWNCRTLPVLASGCCCTYCCSCVY